MRCVITGGPHTGKTTLSETFTIPVYHSDTLIDLGWSKASLEIVRWLERKGPWCIEGVAAVRGLRKWLTKHVDEPTLKPCEYVIFLYEPKTVLTKPQTTMLNGTLTMWHKIRPALIARGVMVVDR